MSHQHPFAKFTKNGTVKPKQTAEAREKRNRFWKSAFLASSLVMSNPLGIHLSHASVSPFETQPRSSASNDALKIFAAKTQAPRSSAKLVQVADASHSRDGSSRSNDGGRQNGGRGTSDKSSGGNALPRS